MTGTSHQSTFLLEEPPANRSQSRDCEKDWMILVATSPLHSLPFLTASGPAGWSGRTSPASYPLQVTPLRIRCHRQTRWTWSSTDRKWTPQTLTNQKNYTHSNASWPDFQNSAMGSPTGFLTLNTSEFPSAAAVPSLSDILETGNVPRRYYLSATACKGILRRADKRGKALPPQLAAALRAVADSAQTSPSTEA